MKEFKDVAYVRMAELRIKPKDIAEVMELSVQHIYSLLNGKRRWSEEQITKVCEVLGLEIQYKKLDGGSNE